MWIIWCYRNDLVFDANLWLVEKTQQVVWDSLLECGGLEWQRTLHDLKKLQWLVMKMFLENLT